MNKEVIKSDLTENNVVDNPFDLMLYYSLELSRALLFASHRFRNDEIIDRLDLYKNPTIITNLIEAIDDQITIMSNVDKDTTAFCRETSAVNTDSELFNDFNSILSEVENSLPTRMSHCVPKRNDEFEKVRLGEDSKDYKRLVELRKIHNDNKDKATSYWYSLCDIITDFDQTKDEMSESEFNDKYNVIKTYNLTEDDIEYIISCCK